MTDTITLTLPLPPMTLSKNARVHWAVRNAAFQKHKKIAFVALREQFPVVPFWPAAVMHLTWYQCAPLPDSDNALARVAAARDAMEAGGLVSNDKYIAIGSINVVRVRTRKEQRVVLRFERRE